MNRTESKILFFLGLTALILGLSGCGGSLYREDVAKKTTAPVAPGTPPSGGGGSGGGGSNIPDGFDATDPSFQFQISGNNGGPTPVFSTLGTDPNNPVLISTNSILRVKLTMGPAQNLTIDGYGAYNSPYTCGQFTVVARRYDMAAQAPDTTSFPQTSPKLAVEDGGDCKHPQSGTVYTSDSDHIFDFSVLTNGGNPHPFFFEVRDARYNWHCSMYAQQPWNPALYWFQQFCIGDAMRPMHYSHMASGRIQVDVNGPSTGN